MMYLLLAIITLGSYCGHIFGSEKKNEQLYKFTVYVQDNQSLVSCGKEYIDFFNKTCGTECKYEEPFLPVCYDAHEIGKRPVWLASVGDSYERPQDWVQIKEGVIKPIKFLPFESFLYWRGFKGAHDTILSFSKKDENQNKRFQIQMASQLITADKPNVLLEKFQNNRGKVGQDNINKSKQATTTKKDDINEFEKLTFFHSHFKKFFGGSLVIIALYALYKKFYTAAN